LARLASIGTAKRRRIIKEGTMIEGDMKLKHRTGMRKIYDAIEAHDGITLACSGATDDVRIALAAVEAGARILEPNHGERALALGYKGAKNMHDTVPIRHEISVEEMANVVRGIRNVVSPEIFVFVGVPHNFTELVPLPLTDELAAMLSRAGADGLHTHKSTLEDLQDVVTLAHKYGLVVDAYIADPKDPYPFGIPAANPEDVARVAREMQDTDVDIIGLVTDMSYGGISAGDLSPYVRERLEALANAIDAPTAVEGGINMQNFRAFIGTGVNIMVVGTSITDAAREAVRTSVRTLLAR
jgi:cyclase